MLSILTHIVSLKEVMVPTVLNHLQKVVLDRFAVTSPSNSICIWVPQWIIYDFMNFWWCFDSSVHPRDVSDTRHRVPSLFLTVVFRAGLFEYCDSFDRHAF